MFSGLSHSHCKPEKPEAGASSTGVTCRVVLHVFFLFFKGILGFGEPFTLPPNVGFTID